MTHAMHRQMIKRNQGINLEDLHDIAVREGRPKSEMSGYPMACQELAQRIADEERNKRYGPVTNKERDLVARGMPRAELTNRYGESIVERSDYKLKIL
jgi:hypothetical protein